MEQRKAFSHGLLYSIPPQNLSSLHLNGEESQDEFEWREFKSYLSGVSVARYILSALGKAVSAIGRK
ncbi:hypothetical protein GALL_75730 [mine drainage metagenome]|uniref:Uncharacterized protein n=1 Tax=mine drainage metagenome TaxID=410659 RepID=A0A1J5SQK6_9ZZZZ